MSLQDAKMPRLIDKLETQAEAAEKVRAKLEKQDAEIDKIIKKSAKKK